MIYLPYHLMVVAVEQDVAMADQGSLVDIPVSVQVGFPSDSSPFDQRLDVNAAEPVGVAAPSEAERAYATARDAFIDVLRESGLEPRAINQLLAPFDDLVEGAEDASAAARQAVEEWRDGSVGDGVFREIARVLSVGVGLLGAGTSTAALAVHLWVGLQPPERRRRLPKALRQVATGGRVRRRRFNTVFTTLALTSLACSLGAAFMPTQEAPEGPFPELHYTMGADGYERSFLTGHPLDESLASVDPSQAPKIESLRAALEQSIENEHWDPANFRFNYQMTEAPDFPQFLMGSVELGRSEADGVTFYLVAYVGSDGSVKTSDAIWNTREHSPNGGIVTTFRLGTITYDSDRTQIVGYQAGAQVMVFLPKESGQGTEIFLVHPDNPQGVALVMESNQQKDFFAELASAAAEMLAPQTAHAMGENAPVPVPEPQSGDQGGADLAATATLGPTATSKPTEVPATEVPPTEVGPESCMDTAYIKSHYVQPYLEQSGSDSMPEAMAKFREVNGKGKSVLVREDGLSYAGSVSFSPVMYLGYFKVPFDITGNSGARYSGMARCVVVAYPGTVDAVRMITVVTDVVVGDEWSTQGVSGSDGLFFKNPYNIQKEDDMDQWLNRLRPGDPVSIAIKTASVSRDRESVSGIRKLVLETYPGRFEEDTDLMGQAAGDLVVPDPFKIFQWLDPKENVGLFAGIGDPWNTP